MILPGSFVAKVVDLRALKQREHTQGGLRQHGSEWECLEAGEQAVSAKYSHEPRQASRRQRPWNDHRTETERGKINQASPVDPGQIVPGTDQAGGVAKPLLQAVVVRDRVSISDLCSRPVSETDGDYV